MSVSYGFFNAVNGDRVYDANDLSSMFNGLLIDGVFKLYLNKFAVVPDTGMNINVQSGKAWFNNTWILNDADLSLSISAAHISMDRIDTVVIEVNSDIAVRANSIKVITGTPSGTPVPPTLTNTDTCHQYALAHIAVGAGVTSIVLGNITNVVGTIECPYVTFPEPINTDTDAANIIKVQVFT